MEHICLSSMKCSCACFIWTHFHGNTLLHVTLNGAQLANYAILASPLHIQYINHGD